MTTRLLYFHSSRLQLCSCPLSYAQHLQKHLCVHSHGYPTSISCYFAAPKALACGRLLPRQRRALPRPGCCQCSRTVCFLTLLPGCHAVLPNHSFACTTSLGKAHIRVPCAYYAFLNHHLVVHAGIRTSGCRCWLQLCKRG